jgi:hypothetical protein
MLGVPDRFVEIVSLLEPEQAPVLFLGLVLDR